MRRFLVVALVGVLAVVGLVAYGVFSDGERPALLGGEPCTAKVDGLEADVSLEQARNASLIAAIGIGRGLPARAVTIALATAFQESKLYNLPSGDRDSIGLFQQRPSQGWGTPAQLRDPVYAANAFYDALVKVPDYETMPITEAAQEVQRSAFPDAYAAHESPARALASALTGYSPHAFTCQVDAPTRAGSAAAVRRDLTTRFGALSVTPDGGGLRIAPTDRRQGWALAQYLVAQAGRLRVDSVSYAGRTWSAARSDEGWRGMGSQELTIGLG